MARCLPEEWRPQPNCVVRRIKAACVDQEEIKPMISTSWIDPIEEPLHSATDSPRVAR